jgi:hypothetical protein
MKRERENSKENGETDINTDELGQKRKIELVDNCGIGILSVIFTKIPPEISYKILSFLSIYTIIITMFINKNSTNYITKNIGKHNIWYLIKKFNKNFAVPNGYINLIRWNMDYLGCEIKNKNYGYIKEEYDYDGHDNNNNNTDDDNNNDNNGNNYGRFATTSSSLCEDDPIFARTLSEICPDDTTKDNNKSVDYFGFNLCYQAAKYNQFETLKWLVIEKSCRLHPRIMEQVVKTDNVEMFDWVLELGIIPSFLSLVIASSYSYCIFKSFFNRKKCVIEKDLCYLHYGIMHNNIDAVKFLIEEKKYDPDLVSLMVALEYDPREARMSSGLRPDDHHDIFNYLIQKYDLLSDKCIRNDNNNYNYDDINNQHAYDYKNYYKNLQINDIKSVPINDFLFYLGYSGNKKIVEDSIEIFHISTNFEYLIAGAISHGEKNFFKWAINKFQITKISSHIIATGIGSSKNKENGIYNTFNWIAKKKNYCIVNFDYNSPMPACACIENSYPKLFKWIISNTDERSYYKNNKSNYDGILNLAISKGIIEILEIMSNGIYFEIVNDLYKEAITSANVNTLKWLKTKNEAKFSSKLVFKYVMEELGEGHEKNIILNYIDILEWIYTIDAKLIDSIVELFNKIEDNRDPISRYILENGQINILKWIESKGYRLDILKVWKYALYFGHYKILKWIYNYYEIEYCYWSEGSLKLALLTRNPKLIKFLYNINKPKKKLETKPCNASTIFVNIAIIIGDLPLLKWLIGHGYNYDADSYNIAKGVILKGVILIEPETGYAYLLNKKQTKISRLSILKTLIRNGRSLGLEKETDPKLEEIPAYKEIIEFINKNSPSKFILEYNYE